MRRGRLPGWVTLLVVPVAVAVVVLGSALLLAPGSTTGPAPEEQRLGKVLTGIAPEVESLPDPPHTRPDSTTTRSPCLPDSDAAFVPTVQRRWWLDQDVSGTGFHPEVTAGAREAVRSLAASLRPYGWSGSTRPDDYGSVTMTGRGGRGRATLAIYCFGDRILLRVSLSGRDVCRHLA